MRAALASALLFGAGVPVAKLLVADVAPTILAGLLYLGAGLGLSAYRVITRAPRVRLDAASRLPLVGAIAFGGILGPVLLMLGLAAMPSSGASLLLNAESVFTAVIAWVVFRENVDRRVLLGMVAIVAGAVMLSVPAGVELGSAWPSLLVLAACACWAIDNNLTRKIALTDASWVAAVKGCVAGPVNLAIGLAAGASLPSALLAGEAMLVGLASYGVSLALFVVALRHLGTARAGAYFSVAPFFGAVLGIALGDPITWPLVVAGALMAVGVWLHLSEQHAHPHTHVPVTHEHWHVHDDDHHDHPHDPPAAEGVRHRHVHTHAITTHTHEHYPDAHHRHEHRPDAEPGEERTEGRTV